MPTPRVEFVELLLLESEKLDVVNNVERGRQNRPSPPALRELTKFVKVQG